MIHSHVRPFVEITTPKWLSKASGNVNRELSHSTASSSRAGASSITVIEEQPNVKRKKKLQLLDYVRVPQKRPLENPSTQRSSPKRRRKSGGFGNTVNARQLSPTVSENQHDFDEHLSSSRLLSPEFPEPESLFGATGTRTPLSRPYTPLSAIFEDSQNDVPEDNNLDIPGEDDLGITFDHNGDEIVPVRVLSKFTIYHSSHQELISLQTLNGMDLDKERVGATGIVKPWIAPDGDDALSDGEEDIEYPSVKLSRIAEFDIHHYSLDGEGTESFDGKIYIRTEYAWYILDRPSPIYLPFFKQFFIQHRLCHLILRQLLLDPELTTQVFLQSLEDNQDQEDGLIPKEFYILGRNLKSGDLQRGTRGYLSTTISQILSLYDLKLDRSEIISTILSSKTSQFRQESPVDRPHKKRTNSNMELQVLKNKNDTVVTPVVERIVRDLYNLTLEVAGTSTVEEEEDEALVKEIQNVIEHHEDPKRVKWGKRIATAEHFYESVYLDGEVYTIGDDVMVSVGEDEMDDGTAEFETPSDSEDEQDSRVKDSIAGTTGLKGNYYAKHVWFCKISYFFDDLKELDARTGKPIKKFHGQWFNHGHKTFLQETAHSRSLFLLPKCDDNPVASIFRRCKIRFLGLGENEDVDDKDHMGAEFHCALMLDEVQSAFIDIPSDDDMVRLCESQPDHKKCLGCALQCKEEDETKIQRVSGGFSRYGVEYHTGDFVYVLNAESTLLEVAQILEMKRKGHESVSVSVKCFSRRDDVVEREKGDPAEEKRLLATSRERKIDFQEIDGKCFVRHLTKTKAIESWIQQVDHWFLNEEETDDEVIPISAKAIKGCDKCLTSRQEELDHFQDTLNRRGKLRGLDLFSGGGGMSTGMDYSGIVDTQWMVEISPASARTYQANHPQTTVYCQDVNLLLKHVIETREGKDPKPLRSYFNTRENCPEMPKRGQVDFIFGGPPCQAFSGANHSPKANDIRSSLPCNMLSYVEEFEPDYFLLENVTGLLRFPLKSKNDGNRLVGGIKMGMVKMIVRVLIALGYQVRFKILEAGQYGAPQSRKRIIFWGARRGLKLPDFPAPTHTFPKTAGMWKLPCERGKVLLPATRTRDPDRIGSGRYNHAPLKNVTVFDAIEDLQPFEWKNPHLKVPATPADKATAKARSNMGIIQCDAVQRGDLPGFPNGVEYATPPLNAYQRWMREKMEGNDVLGHYTNFYGAKVVESTVTVPLRKANHRALPMCLWPRCAKPGKKQENKSFYVRGDGDQYFSTALTNVAPNSHGVASLHPSQKRIYTVRETARSQGFPDHYVFCSENGNPRSRVQDMYRQIGNAVPVPLARALGMALGEALRVNWEREEREGSPVH